MNPQKTNYLLEINTILVQCIQTLTIGRLLTEMLGEKSMYTECRKEIFIDFVSRLKENI